MPAFKKSGHPGLGRTVNAKLLAATIVKNRGNYSAAARDLGLCRSTVGIRVEKTPAVQAEILTLLRRCKVTPTKVIRKLYEGLSATNKQYFALLGTVSDEREDPDYATRHKNSVTLLQLMGYLKGSNGAGHGDINATGDVHVTTVMQQINSKEFEDADYASNVRTLSDALCRQRA